MSAIFAFNAFSNIEEMYCDTDIRQGSIAIPISILRLEKCRNKDNDTIFRKVLQNQYQYFNRY